MKRISLFMIHSWQNGDLMIKRYPVAEVWKAKVGTRAEIVSRRVKMKAKVKIVSCRVKTEVKAKTVRYRVKTEVKTETVSQRSKTEVETETEWKKEVEVTSH